MKKTFQKVAAILTAALLVFLAIPFSTTAYADETKTGTITINTDQGTYSIYQIFSLTIDENSAYIYTANTDWVTFLNTCYVYTDNSVDIFITSSDENWSSVSEEVSALFTLNESGVLSADSAIFNYEEDDDVLKDFAEAVVQYAQINTINADYTLPVTEGEEEPSYSVNVDYGWYVIDSSLGTLVMVDNVDGGDEVTINEKNGTPTIEKYITQKDQSIETSDNGDTVEFIIYINNIANTSDLVLHDALPTEMTLEEGSITVTLYDEKEEGTSGTTLSSGTDYTLNTSPSCTGTTDVSCTFEIKFEDETLANLDKDAWIQVTYSVTVKTENNAYTNNMDELINYAQLTYGTTGKTPVVEAKDELFGIEIVKYAYTTGTDAANSNVLFGATFTLTNDKGKTAYFTQDTTSVYYFEEWVASEGTPTETGCTCEVVSETNGTIKIEGLDAGTYTLTETVAPNGYHVLKSSITVTITYEDGTPSWAWSYDLGEDSGSDSIIYIGNIAGGALAGTGGIGTTIFYIVGGVIIVAAIILFITRKRMERAEKNK